MILAITGATGFVGGHLVDQALAAGHHVRALTRRAQPPREDVTWVEGDLAHPGALMEGTEAAIHVAGVVNALDRAGFAAGNIDGTASILAAARQAEVGRFVHVSSLAAREPQLSDYGWSKAEGDELVRASPLNWTIVRPPAIFGPGDRELLELFGFAKRGVVPLPPAGGRLSVLYAPDLAALLLALAADRSTVGATLEPDDGKPGAWDHRDFARAIGTAIGRRILPLPLPRAALSLGAALDRLIRGQRAKLTSDRVRYFAHRDWSSHLPAPADLWRAATPTPIALAQTARWYRANGLL